MNEIKCPKCGELFRVDESTYNSIASQIKDKEFNEELLHREALLKKQLELEKEKDSQAYESQIEKLNFKLKEEEQKSKSSLDLALANKDAEIKDLENKIALLKASEDVKLATALKQKEEKIAELEKNLLSEKFKSQEEISKAKMDSKEEINNLKGELSLVKAQHEQEKANLLISHQNEMKIKEEELERYKDFRLKTSTKLLGESLEQHCQIEFNKLRSMVPMAFKNAYFDKDNDARTGSKGDFIFRDKSDDGVEFISIMFEMKNEASTTATKHKNEDFFKELDKDRREKNCEYAVLVSMLESDNELYNNGIVDVSHHYPQMYVIRPQFFIPLITILRDAALKNLETKRALVAARSQEVDVTNFEAKLKEFQDKFGANVLSAQNAFEKAIDEIDKTINHLNKVKESLLTSGNQLRLANNKAQDLTIRRLTHNNKTMKNLFVEAKED